MVDVITHYYLNKVAAFTGLRLGEILALRPSDFNNDYITVSHAWNRIDKLKGTKTGKTRIVPVPSDLIHDILNTCSPIDDGFLFSANHGLTPFDHKMVYRAFWKALDAINLTKSIRESRNISFHSYRHTFNTRLLEAGVHPETVRLLTGHSPAMTAHYAHLSLDAKLIPPSILY